MGTITKNRPVERVWIGASLEMSSGDRSSKPAIVFRSWTAPNSGSTWRISPKNLADLQVQGNFGSVTGLGRAGLLRRKVETAKHHRCAKSRMSGERYLLVRNKNPDFDSLLALGCDVPR